MTCELWVFPVLLVGLVTVPHPVWAPDIISYNSFGWLFPQSWAVSSHMHTLVQGVPYADLQGLLQLSLLWALCPMDTSCPGLHAVLPLPPQVKGFVWLCLGFPPWAMACTIPSGSKLGNSNCSLFSFPVSWRLLSLFFWCPLFLKTLVSCISFASIVSGRKVSLVLFAPSWLEAEVLPLNFVKFM